MRCARCDQDGGDGVICGHGGHYVTGLLNVDLTEFVDGDGPWRICADCLGELSGGRIRGLRPEERVGVLGGYPGTIVGGQRGQLIAGDGSQIPYDGHDGRLGEREGER